MKTRFNTYDTICIVAELQKLIDMRVNNIYDVDNKTYLIRLQEKDNKQVLLLESGNRLHLTGYEWPKNVAPSGFSMKLRKHLKNKRLVKLYQLGCDRIVVLQFGTGEAAYNVILELFDRGNIVLTDHEMTILNILRPHTEGEKLRFAVREKYPADRGRGLPVPSVNELRDIFAGAKAGDPLKKIMLPRLDLGPTILEHVMLKFGFANSAKIGKGFDPNSDLERLHEALTEGDRLLSDTKQTVYKGYMIQKKEEKPNPDLNAPKEFFYTNQEFHPALYIQHENLPNQEYESFNQAVDEFFSQMQSQKIDMKAIQQERDAIKKLDNIKKDHSERLVALGKVQETDEVKAELITKNQQLVDNAILAMQSALASQISWSDIEALVKEAANKGDPIAKQIKQLKLNSNHISMLLSDPYDEESDKSSAMVIDIDLGLTAFANARRYYDQRKTAAKKQQKTIESQSKAFKNAEKKTKQVLKEMQTTTSINKARKVYWFEKFFWFISSENYLVVAGRDQQQNELLVKRYMLGTDYYVHADVHGASSVIIKNPTAKAVPPKTVNEAGTMAICYSVAWEAKVLTNAYWVLGTQVSKIPPTGEYLTTGSFMIRGKKNFLPPSHLILGLGFLFRLEDGSVERHKDERKVVALDSIAEEEAPDSEEKDEEIVVSDGSDDEDYEQKGDEVSEQNSKSKDNEDFEQNSESKDAKSETEDPVEDKQDADEATSSEEDETSLFPDTQIKIEHTEGTKINVLTESSNLSENDKNKMEIEERMEKAKQRSRTASENSNKSRQSYVQSDKVESRKQVQAKRGQKSKLKKIKEKYADQDEEERQLRMTILQSAGSNTNSKKSKKKEAATKAVKKTPRAPKPRSENPIDVEDEPVVQVETDMLDALTGIPVPEDELLFAVPVIAPYNTLTHYKFKVKLTPGTSKRGKAAKTAVNMFLYDKATTPREKDLLKAVKDETLARNLPGKVKLSAPKLQAHRK